MSRVYSLKAVQKIPVVIDTAWDFFSNPANLKNITPATLGFKMISKHHGEMMYPGQIIEYEVRPLLQIPLYWMTEITHVEPKKFFIDEQRFGPYRFWHHQHHFETIETGVKMTDIVHYKLPFWFIGDIANTLLVRKKLEGIFKYRYEIICETFGARNKQAWEISFY